MTKTQKITNEITQNVNVQKKLFRILASGSIILFAVYVYLVGSITFDVIARKSLETTIATLTSEVNNLDLTYLNNTNKINKEYALANGFVESHQNIFVLRDTASRVAIR